MADLEPSFGEKEYWGPRKPTKWTCTGCWNKPEWCHCADKGDPSPSINKERYGS